MAVSPISAAGRHPADAAPAAGITVHGVCVEVFGTGLLLTGPSGVGKSELALALVSRGHRLIADDAPHILRTASGTLQAACPPMLRDLLHVRDLGVLDMRATFGAEAVQDRTQLHLILDLRPGPASPPGRLHGGFGRRRILCVDLLVIFLHAFPGRPLALLAEAAVRKHRLAEAGHDAARVLEARQAEQLEARNS